LPDGCFGLVDPDDGAAPLVRLIREFRPHVVLTYDENGGYPHPDHIMCHKISVVAFDAAGDPDRYPEAGNPWQPLKLYYHAGWSRQRITSLHEAVLEAGLESPYVSWLERWDDAPDSRERVTTRVVCGDWFPQRDDALRAHATQVDPDSSWFAVPIPIQRAAWPTEDFELARSLVDTSLPEDDLFAGIRETVDVSREALGVPWSP
jgi:mycothiol S-conjugate amidase